jgi:hypothetical protein
MADFFCWHDACDDNLSLTSSFPLFQPRTECENFPNHPFEPFGWDGVIILRSEDSYLFLFSCSSTSLENCWDQKAIPWSGSKRTLWPKWLCLAAVLWRTNRRYACSCSLSVKTPRGFWAYSSCCFSKRSQLKGLDLSSYYVEIRYILFL